MDWQTSDALRREDAEVWLFESVDQKFYDASTQIQHVGRNKRGVSDAHCAALRERAEDRWRNALRLLRPTADLDAQVRNPSSLCRWLELNAIPWLWIPGSREERAPE
jgi:hypothetical protein